MQRRKKIDEINFLVVELQRNQDNYKNLRLQKFFDDYFLFANRNINVKNNGSRYVLSNNNDSIVTIKVINNNDYEFSFSKNNFKKIYYFKKDDNKSSIIYIERNINVDKNNSKTIVSQKKETWNYDKYWLLTSYQSIKNIDKKVKNIIDDENHITFIDIINDNGYFCRKRDIFQSTDSSEEKISYFKLQNKKKIYDMDNVTPNDILDISSIDYNTHNYILKFNKKL